MVGCTDDYDERPSDCFIAKWRLKQLDYQSNTWEWFRVTNIYIPEIWTNLFVERCHLCLCFPPLPSLWPQTEFVITKDWQFDYYDNENGTDKGAEYNPHVRERNAVCLLSGKEWREWTLVRHKYKWKANVKVSTNETVIKKVEWIYLAQDGVHLKDPMNTAISHKLIILQHHSVYRNCKNPVIKTFNFTLNSGFCH
jgi:hypothetical protein